MPTQRRCDKCTVFLPNAENDPHPTCPRCRGGKCSFAGTKCNFCRDWTKAVWDNLTPAQRPYASRNPHSRSKKPGRPSVVVRASTLVKSRAESCKPISGKAHTPSGSLIQMGAASPDSFKGFSGEASTSSQKLKSLQRQ